MMGAMDEVELTVKKHGYWAWVNLDDDGTPLDTHGDRMVEVAPGQWTSWLEAAVMEYVKQHPLTGD